MKTRLLLFLSLLIVAFQILISFPITVWHQNQFNFAVDLVQVLGFLGMIFLVASAVSFLFVLFIPENFRRHLIPIIVLVSLLVYLQQNVLVWDYGYLDGSKIDFRNNNYLGLIDLLLWGGGVLIFVLFRRQIIKMSGTILLFSWIITLLATTLSVTSLDFEKNRTRGTIGDLEKFSFSAQENILLFILDGFQSDLFWDLIDHEPDLKNAFAGFTYYPDTTAVFSKTYPTIPLLLTGRTFTKQEPFDEFLSQSYEDSLLTSLVDNGWDVGLYPRIKSTVAIDDSIMSNFVELVGWDEKVESYFLALNLSLFRVAPHFMKSLVYNDGNFVIQKSPGESAGNTDFGKGPKKVTSLPKLHVHDGLNFLNNFQTSGNRNSEKPSFRFYHLNMPHKPFLLDRNLEYGPRPDGFPEYRDYAYASVKLMIAYLQELKRLGVFDNSSIIITADHGGGEYTDKKYISANRQYVSIGEDGQQKASGRPLLLIKRPLDNSPFRLSSKPASLLDIAPTIASLAGIDDMQFDGKAIDEILEGESRTRIYYFYWFSGHDSKYLGDFFVYQIEGDAYDESAWKMQGMLTAPQFKNIQSKYVLSSIVSYGLDAKSDADYVNAFLVEDGYMMRPSELISSSGVFDISLDLKKPLKASEVYLLELGVAALNDNSKVTLKINSIEIPSFEFESEKKTGFAFLNPGDLGEKKKLDIHLETKTLSGQESPLSLSRLTLRSADLAKLEEGSVIHFSRNLDAHYLLGFWDANSWGRWTSSKKSIFHFRSNNDFCPDNFIHLEVKLFYAGVNPEEFKVHLNDEVLKQVRIKESENKTGYFFQCEKNQLKNPGVNQLVFSTDTVVSPSSIGRANDRRKLGIGFLSLGITAKNGIAGDSQKNPMQ